MITKTPTIAPPHAPNGLFNRLGKWLNFGYDAVDAKGGKRRAPSPLNRSEDAELTPEKRKLLLNQTREVHRNFAVASWMIRTHLNYTATFNFQAKTGDKKLDRRIEALVDELTDPAAFDVAGRHGLPQFVRMCEARRTLDGDIGILKLSNGLVQAIEGDRIRNPLGFQRGSAMPEDAAQLNHGVRLNDVGRAVAYAVHRRTPTNAGNPAPSGFEFERMVSASALYLPITPPERANVPAVNFFRLMDAAGDQVGQTSIIVEKPATVTPNPTTVADSQVYRVPLAKPGYSYQWTADGIWRDTPEPGTKYPQGTVDWLTPKPGTGVWFDIHESKSPSGCRLTPNGWKCN